MKYEKGTFTTVPFIENIQGESPGLQAVYMWICYFCNQDGSCFPSQSTLAKKAGVSINTLKVYLKELEKKGLLSRERRYSGNVEISSVYQLLIGVSKSDIGVYQNLTDGVSKFDGGVYQNLPTELNINLTKSKELNISKDIKDKSLVIDKRDKSIDNIIDTIKKALKDDGLVYASGKQERNRAKNISQNKELKEISEESGRSIEETIYAIVQLSHQSQYAKKINNAVDFHYKWAEVYNYLKNLKQEKIDKQNNFISDMVF